MALHAAEEDLVAACMRRRGFTYRPQPLATGNRIADANPYGLLAVAQAVDDGYGITSTALAVRPQEDANAGESANDRWKEALLGTPAHRVDLKMPLGRQFFYHSDSCVSDAKSGLFGPDCHRLYNTFQVLADALVDKVRADGRHVEAQGAWSACVKDAGADAGTLVL
ncbi:MULTISPECIES: hypothetical protein [unclassified Streptomyces]|uniref:hypothetical protein n=1 Tax=unclassified Streptomyces TaxID=2593676 RepID=UPI000DC78CB9|nr:MULTISPECIES: hypothetical protein [unclassified Streptomyces]AWZ15990.1 hypothetical protein DRB96_31265 [Streptomyces sp. ICC1]